MNSMPTRDAAGVSKRDVSQDRAPAQPPERPARAPSPRADGFPAAAEPNALGLLPPHTAMNDPAWNAAGLPDANLLGSCRPGLGLPGPGIPGPLRWGISVALALGVPLLLTVIVPRLGPGPHATLRIELALQPLGSRSGAAAGSGGAPARGTSAGVERSTTQGGAGSEAARSLMPEPRPAAQKMAPPPAAQPDLSLAPPAAQPIAPRAALPSAPQEAHLPAAASAGETAPAFARNLAAPAPAAPALPARADPAPATSVPAHALDRPAGGGAADGGSAVAVSAAHEAADAAATAAQESAGTGPGGVGGAAGNAGTVGPESLDAGFGLASAVHPAYPAAALAQGRGGRARIEVEIEPSGSVARVRILDETGRWGFGAAAQRAYASARFTPPRLAGRPVRVVLRKTIEFEP